MFDENFTFSRSPSCTASADAIDPIARDPSLSRSVSPCSPISAFPPPPHGYSVTDLAADLDRQRIRPDAQIYYQPCAAYANTTDDDAAWDIPPAAPCSDSEDADSTYSGSLRAYPSDADSSYPAGLRAYPSSASLGRVRSRAYSPSRRSARQSGTRLLCASTHHAKDIAALVSRMVSSSDQCSVAAPPDSLPLRTACATSDSDCSELGEADDEGYNSSGGAENALPSASSRRATLSKLECRRAYDPRSRNGGGAPAIAKEIRFRSKDRGAHSHYRRQRSAGGKTGTA